jgi:hypothetical protein
VLKSVHLAPGNGDLDDDREIFEEAGGHL